MKWIFWLSVVVVCVLIYLNLEPLIHSYIERYNQPSIPSIELPKPPVEVWQPSPFFEPSPIPPPGRKPLAIRLLVLKHSRESMADNDANLAAKAAEDAADKGLKIKVIGIHYIDDVSDLKGFVSEQMKKDAKAGDTLIIHTIGHGHPSGILHNIGNREKVMKAFADAAEENKQETFWWQLSCYACAQLPAISSLNVMQQNIFSMLASSTADKTSGIETQARIMRHVFMELAEREGNIDKNQDGSIVAHELTVFINTLDSAKRGDLIFAKTPEEAIFEKDWFIPILNHSSEQSFDEDYIVKPMLNFI